VRKQHTPTKFSKRNSSSSSTTKNAAIKQCGIVASDAKSAVWKTLSSSLWLKNFVVRVVTNEYKRL
jgi:hypothetical protein